MKYKVVDDPKNLCVKCPKSLREKVFIPKQTKCQYYFTVGKLGESIWNQVLKKLKIRDFIFFDPENRETPVEYNSLFDPHLKNYFSRNSVINHLRKNHLITDKNEIICNVEKYNDLRRSLHRLKTEENFQKQKMLNYQNLLNYQTETSYANLKKQYERKKKFQERYKKDTISDFMWQTPNLKGKRMKMEAERREKFINDVKAYKDRIKRIEQLKVLRENEIRERGLYRNLELIKKQIFVLETRKERRAKIKKRILEREKALMRRLCADECMEPINYIIRCPLKI